MEKLKSIRVVAAILLNEKNEVFSAERGYGELKGKWEFPGGKIEEGESPEQAIVREIKEELGASISVKRFYCNVEYDYPTFHLDMDVFLCEVEEGSLQIEEGIHMGQCFTPIEKLRQEDWCPADALIVNKIIEEGL